MLAPIGRSWRNSFEGGGSETCSPGCGQSRGISSRRWTTTRPVPQVSARSRLVAWSALCPRSNPVRSGRSYLKTSPDVMPHASRLHEDGLTVFVAAHRRDRFRRALASGGKARAKELSRLHDGPELDLRWVSRPVVPAGGSITRESIVSGVKVLAPHADIAHVVSGDRSLDGCTLDVASAVGQALGSREGALISVVPGRVALYVGELVDDTLVLHRPE